MKLNSSESHHTDCNTHWVHNVKSTAYRDSPGLKVCITASYITRTQCENHLPLIFAHQAAHHVARKVSECLRMRDALKFRL